MKMASKDSAPPQLLTTEPRTSRYYGNCSNNQPRPTAQPQRMFVKSTETAHSGHARRSLQWSVRLPFASPNPPARRLRHHSPIDGARDSRLESFLQNLTQL